MAPASVQSAVMLLSLLLLLSLSIAIVVCDVAVAA
jgi:hypothetical protein